MERGKWGARVLSAALMFGLLAGCSGPAEGNPEALNSGGKNVELYVVTSYGGGDEVYAAAVKAYEAATGNSVQDASSTSNQHWKNKVLVDFETGNEPDVLFFFSGIDAEPFISAGKVVDLETIRAEYPEYAGNMRDSMMAVASDGKIYAVPSYGFWENMFVNTKVLADCGVAVPGPDYTWEQFLRDCQTIKDKGYIPIACSLFDNPKYWFEFCVMNNGSLKNQLDIPTSASDAAGQKWAAALNDIKDLYDRGFFPTDTLTETSLEAVQLFGDGEAAFLIDGSWEVNYFVENYSDSLSDYAVAYVPAKGNRSASQAIGGISMGYFITARAWNDPDKRDAAVKFVEHMTADHTLSTFVTTEVTALKNGASPAGLNALQQSAADANANITGLVGPVQDIMTSECKAVLFSGIQSVVTGAMTAEEVVDAAVALKED